MSIYTHGPYTNDPALVASAQHHAGEPIPELWRTDCDPPARVPHQRIESARSVDYEWKITQPGTYERRVCGRVTAFRIDRRAGTLAEVD